MMLFVFFFFKQKTAYEMRISDWSSDVCSSDLLAGALGAWITAAVSPEILRWVLGLSFIGMAVWTMIPDKIEEEETHVAKRFGVFGATLITFFLAEMGDKTQIATIAMAAHYATPLLVEIGRAHV